MNLSDATHSLVDVIRDELLHFQECNYISTAKDNLDSTLNELDNRLTPLLHRENLDLTSYIVRCERDCFSPNFCLIEKNTLLVEFDLINENIDSILAVRNAPQSFPYRMDFAANVRMENGRLVVPREFENREFVLLNLNGRILRRGKLRNNMLLPHEPTVLRIQGAGEVLLK